jgi:hypothetical protein
MLRSLAISSPFGFKCYKLAPSLVSHPRHRMLVIAELAPEGRRSRRVSSLTPNAGPLLTERGGRVRGHFHRHSSGTLLRN